MDRKGWAAASSCLICFVFAFAGQPSRADGTNKPSNPKAQAELVAMQERWVSGSPLTYDPALTSFERLRGTYPGTLEAELAFVETLAIRWCKGEQQAVLSDYQAWLAGSPSPVAQGQALTYFAEYAAQSGGFAKAEGLYKQAIALAGNHIVAGSAAGKLAGLYLEKMNRPADALSLFQQTADRFSGSPIEGNIRRQWARAVSAQAGKAFPEPKEQVGAVLQPVAGSTADPASLAYARYNLGEVLLALSKPEEALTVFECAAPYVDRHKGELWAADCLSLIIMLQRQFGHWDEAIATARRYIELFPGRDPGGAQLAIGLSWMGKKDFARAVAEFEKLLTEYRGDRKQCAMALFQKARCQRALGQLPEARSTLEQLIRDYAETDPGIQAKEHFADILQ